MLFIDIIPPMKLILTSVLTLTFTLFLTGCANKSVPTPVQESSLPVAEESERFKLTSENENFDELLALFRNNCKAPMTKKLYTKECIDALHVEDARAFFRDNFSLRKINPNEQRSMLTGYYEPLLQGSLVKTERFKYPLYAKPKDLVTQDTGSDKRVHGRMEKGKFKPYYTRAEIIKRKMNADVLCYVDDKIDLFFLEVQGSGRVEFQDGRVMFVGYADTNGHPYKSIGRELINRGAFSSPEEVSLQSIKRWILQNPKQTDDVLNTNPSYVFFKYATQKATGSLGLVLTPERSVAVDRAFIPLGALLSVKSTSPSYNVDKFVFAQDTGGAIKGPNRADMFMGYGPRAASVAGDLKGTLEIWMMYPKRDTDF